MLPRQGREAPWEVTHNYESDRKLMLSGAIDDGVIQFESAKPARSTTEAKPRLVA